MDQQAMKKQAQVLRNKRIGREVARATVDKGVVKFSQSVPRPNSPHPMLMAAPPKGTAKGQPPKTNTPNKSNPNQPQQPQPPKKGCAKCRRGG